MQTLAIKEVIYCQACKAPRTEGTFSNILWLHGHYADECAKPSWAETESGSCSSSGPWNLNRFRTAMSGFFSIVLVLLPCFWSWACLPEKTLQARTFALLLFLSAIKFVLLLETNPLFCRKMEEFAREATRKACLVKWLTNLSRHWLNWLKRKTNQRTVFQEIRESRLDLNQCCFSVWSFCILYSLND